jgi:excinuclease ABC subunit C
LRDGRPARPEYRRFRIRTTPDGRTDDYAMMQEVVGRYFHRRIAEEGALPDLVLIDGGKGQLASALEAMGAAGHGNVPVISLAKERARGGRTVSHERIFLPLRKNPVVLSPRDPVLLLLMRIRDEAHRFALSYHRARRAGKYAGNPRVRNARERGTPGDAQ